VLGSHLGFHLLDLRAHAHHLLLDGEDILQIAGPSRQEVPQSLLGDARVGQPHGQVAETGGDVDARLRLAVHLANLAQFGLPTGRARPSSASPARPRRWQARGAPARAPVRGR
jgi:hypothetical protein